MRVSISDLSQIAIFTCACVLILKPGDSDLPRAEHAEEWVAASHVQIFFHMTLAFARC